MKEYSLYILLIEVALLVGVCTGNLVGKSLAIDHNSKRTVIINK